MLSSQNSASTEYVRALIDKGTHFFNDSLFVVSGKPALGAKEELLPYSPQNDLVVTVIMVVSFALLCYALSRGGSFIAHQLSEFFSERKRNNMFEESNNEFSYQGFLILHTSLMLGVFLFDQKLHKIFPDYLIPSWQVLGWSILGCLGYYILKFAMYELVNWVFFERTKCERWREILSLVISLQGVAIFPVLCLSIYSNLEARFVFPIIIFILFFFKILLIYKSQGIFFVKFRGLFYNILYLCTLEMIPLLILWKVIREIC